MENLVLNSAASGVFISLAAYGIGSLVRKKWNSPLANPLLIAIILVILFLNLSGVEYETYNVSAKYLTYLLAPATVSLAIPMYERMQLLKENYAAILTGILSGVLASLVCVLAMALVFHLSQAEYVTLLAQISNDRDRDGYRERVGRSFGDCGGSDHHYRCAWEYGGRADLPHICNPPSGGKGNRTGNLGSCDRNSQSYGDGRDRRSNEQPGYRSGRGVYGSAL